MIIFEIFRNIQNSVKICCVQKKWPFLKKGTKIQALNREFYPITVKCQKNILKHLSVLRNVKEIKNIYREREQKSN